MSHPQLAPLEPPIYESLIEALATQGYAILDDFITLEECALLKERLLELESDDAFHKAGIGHSQHKVVDTDIRGDYIHWIEPDHARPVTLLFLRKLQILKESLNRHLFLGLKDLECHFTYYPVGTFYKTHVDQFQDKSGRKISFVCYLNPDWTPEFGGQLRMHLEGQSFLDVFPYACRLVCFRSDALPHEVLPATHVRLSITGWFLNQYKALSFLS